MLFIKIRLLMGKFERVWVFILCKCLYMWRASSEHKLRIKCPKRIGEKGKQATLRRSNIITISFFSTAQRWRCKIFEFSKIFCVVKALLEDVLCFLRWSRAKLLNTQISFAVFCCPIDPKPDEIIINYKSLNETRDRQRKKRILIHNKNTNNKLCAVVAYE